MGYNSPHFTYTCISLNIFTHFVNKGLNLRHCEFQSNELNIIWEKYKKHSKVTKFRHAVRKNPVISYANSNFTFKRCNFH